MSNLAPRRARLPGIAAIGFAMVGLGGCIQSPAPESIAPVAVSPLKYQGSNCRTLAAQVAYLDEQLAELYTRQRTYQTNNTVYSLTFLQARAALVGPDLVPAIALMKGEREAAGAVLQARC